MEYEVRIKTESPLCLNSGKADVNVDADIVHDALGLPYSGNDCAACSMKVPLKSLKWLNYARKTLSNERR